MDLDVLLVDVVVVNVVVLVVGGVDEPNDARASMVVSGVVVVEMVRLVVDVVVTGEIAVMLRVMLLMDVVVRNVVVLVVGGVDEPNDARASIAVSGVRRVAGAGSSPDAHASHTLRLSV